MIVLHRFLHTLLIVIVSNGLEAEKHDDSLINVYIEKDYKLVLPEQCSALLDVFAETVSNFTLCSIKYARPIRLCEKCVKHYVEFQTNYLKLENTIVNNTSCLSFFISQDRLNAFQEYYNNIITIWDKGHCSDCFDWSANVPKIKNSTMVFNNMFSNTINCITNNMNPLQNDTQEICLNCMQSYVALDDFYKSLSKDSIGVDSICMDIVDSMNTTRSIWSKTLHCCDIRKTPELIFLCCTGIIALLPLLFYVTVRYCRPIRDLPNVLKESRFKQSILRSVQGRIN
ncbi:unnamed protein product [Chilo suppressalis]|uniref:Osteopetrosis-associated transmembrane protein 1 n=1 Tax=Chilo suppressalis TaxID=168631 RepID=A0ABN8BHM4_CHISP|nr:hypothetical protein evm_002812 [Chilo suppressalis]CAH0407832.1 unnamed protein product [Chilo suppressalis]